MCTSFVFIKTNGSAVLADRLQVPASSLRYSEDVRPANTISIVTGDREGREAKAATWWLYLKQTAEGLKPHPDYFSVNSNWRKLGQRPEYKRSRCVIPATAFVESQDGKRPHLLEPEDGRALAFGGIYKTWTDKSTGEVVYSASIITLAGHPALENIHRKSTPLWLPDDKLEQWLDPRQTDTSVFDSLLKPTLLAPLKATPIDKVRSRNPVGEPFVVS